MPPASRYGAASAALAIAALAAPAGAFAAPTLALDRPCYTPGMRIGMSGAGYTPGGAVQATVTLGGATHRFTGTAGPAGEIDGGIPLPDFDADALDATLTAVDAAAVPPGQAPGPEQTAIARFRASAWGMIVPRWGNGRTLGIARPGRMTRVEALGFVGTASTTLYAHYLRRGRLVKTTRIGALTGPCGDLTARFRQFPFKVKRGQTYRVLFDTTRAWPNGDSGILYPRVKIGGGRTIRSLRAYSTSPSAGVAPASRRGTSTSRLNSATRTPS
jgi:hypothetical protein